MRRISAYGIIPCIIAIAVCLGCSDKSTGVGAYNVRNDLVFERTDGSFVDFRPAVAVWCGAWEDGSVDVKTLHVRAGGAQGRTNNYWYLRAVVDDIVPAAKIYFPDTFVWNEPEGADLFVYDEPNELSSQEREKSHGWITFDEIDCGPTGFVQFSIDAVLGSEYHDGDSLRVYGSFRARFLQ